MAQIKVYLENPQNDEPEIQFFFTTIISSVRVHLIVLKADVHFFKFRNTGDKMTHLLIFTRKSIIFAEVNVPKCFIWYQIYKNCQKAFLQHFVACCTQIKQNLLNLGLN